ncbi:MAG: hypothetical protein IKO44_05200, partial [Ruminococcus sp.]|nr:hypothetical protein [Ruminococcus sp.]
PHNHRLTPLYIIRLHIFRHITQILLALRQQGGVEFRQSDEKSDCASDAQWLCGVAIIKYITLSAERQIFLMQTAIPRFKGDRCVFMICRS